MQFIGNFHPFCTIQAISTKEVDMPVFNQVEGRQITSRMEVLEWEMCKDKKLALLAE